MESPFSVYTVDLLSASFGLIDLACVEGDPDIIDDDNNDVLLERVAAPRMSLDCCCNVIGEKAKEKML